MRIGQAAGRVLSKDTSGRPTVLIGKDTRISGYMLEAALEAGFSSVGVDTVLCGPLPTPAVAYASTTRAGATWSSARARSPTSWICVE
jgi:phosphoglucosamine mutase